MRIDKLLTGVMSAGLSLGVLVGCGDGTEVRTEYSPIKQEKGYVVDNLHNDGFHRSSLNVGLTSGGDLSFIPSSVRAPETWGVVFRCEHEKKFVISGSKPEYKALFEKLDPGMNVIIDYKEVLKNTYKDIDEDGKKDLVNSELIDFDFIDANPVKEK